MRVLLVGEAATHRADLEAGLGAGHEVIDLPAEAATSDVHDGELQADDVVVSLRFARPGPPAPPFRLLHVPGAGLDAVALDALDPATAICNVFEHEVPIAEFVLARLLEWEIRAAASEASFTAEAWPELYRRRVAHGELHGKTLGLIGHGRIGQAIAHRARAFGMRVSAVDVVPGDRGDGVEVAPLTELHGLLARSDHVAVACPLTPETEGLVDAAALAAMPAHAVLVNTARAPIVDERALYDALRDGTIAGAVLDVWYRYPVGDEVPDGPSSLPFLELANAWCTPHVSAWTLELSRRRYALIAENVRRLADGAPLRNLVRPGALGASSAATR